LEQPTESEKWWSDLLPDMKAGCMADYYGDDADYTQADKFQIQTMYEGVKYEEELQELLKVSDEIKVRETTLTEHRGRKLSADVVREWVHDYMDNGEPASKDMSETLIQKNEILDEEAISMILAAGEIDTIFLYKVGMEPVAHSVITVAPEKEEKSKYDMDREEIKQIQNIIKLADKIEAVVNKIECAGDQTKTDLGNYVKWLQNDAAEVREWIHNNKKQNKRGR
jgi:hypothetical protein